MTTFNIEIVSDTVCPWCFIGHKQLLKAISTFQSTHGTSDTFNTTWKPFYLDPEAPKVSISKEERYAARFGAERTKAIHARMNEVGKSVGINFKWGGKTGNTRDSHRLIQLGKTKSPETQTKIVEALFAAYFENEQDITDHDVLLAAAKKAGLDEAEARKWIVESDEGGKLVDAEVKEAQERNISGVPHFTLNERFEVEGAQDSTAFVRLLERLKKIEGDEGTAIIDAGSKC
jgi:predicted DsbA family dithiol-disulfide isomerase